MKKNIIYIFVFLLVSSCFHDEKKLIMKCADIKFDKLLGIYKVNTTSTMELMFENDLKKRFNHSNNYVKFHQICELELKNSPKTFKHLYK